MVFMNSSAAYGADSLRKSDEKNCIRIVVYCILQQTSGDRLHGKEVKDWFKPVLNIHTPLSHTFTPISFICPS
jgi:hypothetical protein